MVSIPMICRIERRVTAWAVVAVLAAFYSTFGCEADGRAHSLSDIPEFTVNAQAPMNIVDDSAVGGWVEVSWARRLSDRTVVVADERLGELSFFPPDTRPINVAEHGDGPGEFRYINDVYALPGDSIAVIADGRVSVFDHRGSFDRDFALPYAGEGFKFVGLLRDSVLVLRSWSLGYSLERTGLRLDSVTYVTLAASDGSVRDVFRLPDRWSYVDASVGKQPFWTFPPLFGHAVDGTIDSLLVWGMGDQRRIYLLSESGVPVDSFTVATAAKPVTAADVAAVKSEGLTRAGDNVPVRKAWDQMFDNVPLPRRFPFYDRLVVGADALLWLRSGPAMDADTVSWWAYDATGRAQKVLRLPSRLDLVQISNSWALVIETVEAGTQRVLTLRLVEEGHRPNSN